MDNRSGQVHLNSHPGTRFDWTVNSHDDRHARSGVMHHNFHEYAPAEETAALNGVMLSNQVGIQCTR
jgi:hypothetical protein